MSVDPKKFGITSSLIETVKEALKGSQHKIDVAEPKGKITGADFKKLRGEDADPVVQKNLDKVNSVASDLKKMASEPIKPMGSKTSTTSLPKATFNLKPPMGEAAEKKVPAGHYWSPYHGKVTKMHEPGTRVKTKHGVGVVKSAHSSMDWDDDNNSHYKVNVNGKTHEIHADDLVGKKMGPKRINVKEDAEQVDEAESHAAKQIAARKDAMKTHLQNKIAKKQMSAMQAKANQRLKNINASNDKCSCGDTNESKMKCEMHGGKDKDAKMGREKIEVNPPLREAEDLPKKVVTKGHEIAKSLIKNKASVREPYAVGMAQAKKSAGIKD